MPKAISIIFTTLDDKGKSSNQSIKIPSSHTLAEAAEFAQEMALIIDPITVGQITAANISLPVDISGLGLTPAPGVTSDVEEKGTFQYSTFGGYKTVTRIGCLSDLKVVSGSDSIDLTDADVIAFNNAMIAGLDLPVAAITVYPCDSREDDITTLVWARERFLASGKR